MIEFNSEVLIRLEDIPESDCVKYGLYSSPQVEREDEDTYLDRDPGEAYPVLYQNLLARFESQEEKWRCHVKDWRRCFYWAWKYYFYGGLFDALKRVHRHYEIPNWRLAQFFGQFSKKLPRWKKLTGKELLTYMHSKGDSIPKWNRGPRASLLLSLFQDWPLYQMLVTMIAIEEGREPETIYKGIKRARRCLKPHKV